MNSVSTPPSEIPRQDLPPTTATSIFTIDDLSAKSKPIFRRWLVLVFPNLEKTGICQIILLLRRYSASFHTCLDSPYCTHDLSFGIKPLVAEKAIHSAYQAALGADRGYVGLITKSPLSARWDVRIHNVAYDLAYLAEFVDLKPLPRRAANDDSALGRNCSLFYAVRKRAYAIVGECIDERQPFIRVLNTCQIYNAEAFCTPLEDTEVRNTAKEEYYQVGMEA
jgi:hypothetical protein